MSASRSKTIREKVKQLWEDQLGLCRWCGQETYPPGDPKRFRSVSGTLSGKAATLDHLYTRFNPLRRHRIIGKRYVMACSTCNGKHIFDADRAALADLTRRHDSGLPVVVRLSRPQK